MPLTFQCTKFAVRNGQKVIIEDRPFLRLTNKGQEVYIQAGQVFQSGTERLNDLPDWFEDAIKLQSKEALDAVGWKHHKKVGRPPSKETVEKRLNEDA